MSLSSRLFSASGQVGRTFSFALALIFCLQLTGRLAIAQDPVVYEPTAEPVVPEPEPIAWQPPADASSLGDFTPSGAVTMTVPIELPGGEPITTTVEPPAAPEFFNGEAPLTSTVMVTPTLFLTPTEGMSATVALNGLLTNVVSFDQGQVAVVIEEETVASDAELQFTAVPVPVYPVTYTHTLSNPAQTRYLMQFQLDMVQDGVMVSEFEKPVRIVVDLRGLTEELDPTYAGNFFLAYQDENDPTLWHDVPITVHQEDGLISAEVTHFSTWASGTRPTYWKPSFTPPTVSSFSGAATFSQGIEAPVGRNGLQPNISLSYSSRALDGLIQDVDAGEVAHGWSLTNISISRREVELKHPYNDPTFAPELIHPDKFSLVLNGTSYEIYAEFPANTATATEMRYFAKDGPGLFIKRYYDSGLPTDGIYWVVITPDGTLFRLGYTTDSEKWQQAAYRQISGHQGDVNDKSAAAWYVDTVTDAFGNQMQYTYFNHTDGENVNWVDSQGYDQSWTLNTRRVRIDTIRYNYPNRVLTLPPSNATGRLTTTPATRIEFRKAFNDQWDLNTDPIENIYLYHNSTTPIKEYRIVAHTDGVQAQGCLNYDPVPAEPRTTFTRVVDSIQQFANIDSDPLTNDGWGLPATTFSYVSLAHHYKNGQPCFSFRYLSQVNNGYGGSTSFTYTDDGRTIGAYQYITYGQYNWPEFGRNYFVTQVTSNDSRNQPVNTTYSYTGPCYDQTSTNVGTMTGATRCYNSATSPEYDNIVGFATTTQTNYDYNGTTILGRTVTTFGQTVGLNLGRPIQTDVGLVDSGGNFVVLNRTYNDYTTSTFGPNLSFIYTLRTKTWQFQYGVSSNALSTKTEYGYDTTYQGNAQYGNLTHIYEYDDADAATPYRTTRRWYYPNTGAASGSNWYWNVNKVGAEGIYQDNSWTQLGVTWTYYDNNSNWITAPTQGTAKKVRRVLLDSNFTCSDISGGGGSGCIYAYQTADSTFGYDVYGNQTTITTYSNYRYQTFNSSWGLIQEGDLGSPVPRQATIAYETGYNLYPISVTNPASQVTNFQVYGFNGVAVDGFQEQTGLLKQVTAPNGVITKYEYDPFGRLHAVYDGWSFTTLGSFSGFADTDPWNGDPMERYRYWDTTWNNATTYLNPAGNAPFHISIQKRPGTYPQPADASSGFAFNEQTFFDGFGRPIQTRSIWNWIEGQNRSREIISSTAYGANGQVSCQTIPYDVAFYSDRGLTWPASPFVNEACTSKDRTTTTYDALGRPLIVAAPDGTQTEYAYWVLNGTVTVDGRNRLFLTEQYDANEHLVQHLTNSLGQLAMVRELSGAVAPYTQENDMRYYYDRLGNLTEVLTSLPLSTDPTTGQILRQSTMSYDSLGRKVGMTDPDMGTWSYGYDAIGNLTFQIDAKLRAVNFYYDNLDRILGKAYSASTVTPATYVRPADPGCSAYAVCYTYDTANSPYGIGQIAQVRWSQTLNSGGDTFTYDSLGRLMGQTRWIDGRSYTLTYGDVTLADDGFDAFHRATVMTYPNGDKTNVGFDHEGENSLSYTISGTTTNLVSKLTYNARGQMRILERPAAGVPDTTYTYFNAADAAGGGSGDSNFRLQQIQTGSLLNNTYTYDKVGQVKTIVDELSGDNTQTFTYDSLNRLDTASAPAYVVGGMTIIPSYSYDYLYDDLGNLLGMNGSTTYTYGNSAHKHAVTAITGGNSFTYDANGNMITRTDSTGNYNQGFDVENRLVTVTDLTDHKSTYFRYDASGQRVMTLSQADGTITYTPFPNYEEEVPLLFTSGLENSGELSEMPSTTFPGTSLYRSFWGTATPYQETYSDVISNHAYGTLQSGFITVSPSTQYNLYAYVRGEIDPDDSSGQWIIRARFYDSSNTYLGYQDADSGSAGSLTATWQQQGGAITTLANTVKLRVELLNYMNTGWVAYDDVSLKLGSGSNLVANPGFESIGNWTEITATDFLGTSFWRSTWGTASPHAGTYAYVISNHAYGALRSELVNVTAGTQYDVYTYIRGEIDPEDSGGAWKIQVQYFDSSNNSLSSTDVDSGTTTSSWQQQGGTIIVPTGAAKLQVLLYNYQNNGWVAFDDVSLKQVGNSTNLLANPGFESSGYWTTDSYPTFPATAYWRSTWGTAGPRSGSYGYVITNHTFGYLQSAALPVTPNTDYDLYAFVRGEIDADDSNGYWELRAQFYDASGTALAFDVADSGTPGSLATTWTEQGGRVTAPANAATVRLHLYHYNDSGWVAFDNVRLSKPNGSTTQRATYGIGGQAIAIRVTGDPISGNNGLFYLYSDHLGSNSVMSNSSGSEISSSRTRYLPFGGYRTTPSQTITDIGYTGHKENIELGLVYMNARYYLPGVGRFISADTIVPNPQNPQSWNRYSYVRNSPLSFIDPSGHRECGLEGIDCENPESHKATPTTPKLSDKLSKIEPIFEGLPVQDATWHNGFGANSFTEKYADPDSPNYTGIYSSDSAGIHPGIDFGKAYDPDCAECMLVYANVTGVVKVGIFDGDADPNVVIEVDLGNGEIIYVIYGHVNRTVVDGTVVHSGDPIGTLQDQRVYVKNEDGTLKLDINGNPILDYDNTHVHLAVRQGSRIFNPAYFWKDPSEITSIDWGYPSWENLYSISSYEYTPGQSYWRHPGNTFGITRD